MLSRFLNYFLEKHMLRWMHTSGSLCSFCVSFLLSLFFLFFVCFQGEKVLDLNFSLRRRVIEPFDLKSFQGKCLKIVTKHVYLAHLECWSRNALSTRKISQSSIIWTLRLPTTVGCDGWMCLR